ncbi:hypothetical protein [Dyella caseinilytica]|uniref:DUF4440 domain-containing protein n=1 Tax=Dyella caseinilytica TaxID=1849581 RepID=A0ABX7GTZ1_9GAMM|nr:hypothetical protein [Dyella caseinilytica]QRN53902.1 hypothetical protein ISN74_00320 [Dyella caseinilytica]GFZ90017.1 hypothetical protein GCM10011408_06360 [Dyella caseinilytica]
MKGIAYRAFAVVAGISIATQAIGAELASQSTEGQDLPALHALWSRYQQAVARKDVTALLDMYVSGDAPVMGGIAPKSYAVITAANKQPVPRTFLSTAKQEVAGEIKLPPDQIENLNMYSDGEVGSISFDYKASVGHGRIIWTTVHTNDGWKIASVVYSINVPAADSKNTSG